MGMELRLGRGAVGLINIVENALVVEADGRGYCSAFQSCVALYQKNTPKKINIPISMAKPVKEKNHTGSLKNLLTTFILHSLILHSINVVYAQSYTGFLT